MQDLIPSPQLPAALDVQCLAGGRPFAGAWVSVRLGMREKNEFVLHFGPADEHGELTITTDQLRAQVEDEMRTFVMDYRHPDVQFDGRIVVAVLGRSAIRRAIDAYETWSAVSPYPPQYVENLRAVLERVERLGSCLLEARVKAEGADEFDVVVNPVDARD